MPNTIQESQLAAYFRENTEGIAALVIQQIGANGEDIKTYIDDLAAHTDVIYSEKSGNNFDELIGSCFLLTGQGEGNETVRITTEPPAVNKLLRADWRKSMTTAMFTHPKSVITEPDFVDALEHQGYKKDGRLPINVFTNGFIMHPSIKTGTPNTTITEYRSVAPYPRTMLFCQKPHTVRTDPVKGFTYAVVYTIDTTMYDKMYLFYGPNLTLFLKEASPEVFVTAIKYPGPERETVELPKEPEERGAHYEVRKGLPQWVRDILALPEYRRAERTWNTSGDKTISTIRAMTFVADCLFELYPGDAPEESVGTLFKARDAILKILAEKGTLTGGDILSALKMLISKAEAGKTLPDPWSQADEPNVIEYLSRGTIFCELMNHPNFDSVYLAAVEASGAAASGAPSGDGSDASMIVDKGDDEFKAPAPPLPVNTASKEKDPAPGYVRSDNAGQTEPKAPKDFTPDEADRWRTFFDGDKRKKLLPTFRSSLTDERLNSLRPWLDNFLQNRAEFQLLPKLQQAAFWQDVETRTQSNDDLAFVSAYIEYVNGELNSSFIDYTASCMSDAMHADLRPSDLHPFTTRFLQEMEPEVVAELEDAPRSLLGTSSAFSDRVMSQCDFPPDGDRARLVKTWSSWLKEQHAAAKKL